MGINFNVDQFITIIFWVGIAIIAAALLLLVIVMGMRFSLMSKNRRRNEFLEVWRPLLAACIEKDLSQVPDLRVADIDNFLNLWNHNQECLRGGCKENLNSLARRLGIDEIARKRLAHGDLRARLLAISTLGNLRDEAAWQALQGFAYHKDPHLSLTAARALLRINADAAVNLLVPLISTRKDWSLAKLANLFGEANPELIAQPLAEAALRADQMHAPRLIRLLNIARNKTTLSAVIDIISTCQDDETILACLSILEEFQEPKTLPILRKFLDHENWRIRVRSTVALGMIATPEDEQRFIALLSDPQWWVRYRAAQALAHQPFINSYKLARIRSELTDVFAREALLQAMAEMRFGISRQIMVKQRLAALKELEKVQTAQQSLSASGIIELPAPASADSSAAKIAEGGMQKCS